MPKRNRVAVFGRERGEAFLARALGHAAHHHPTAQLMRRSAPHFVASEREPFEAVYVEGRFPDVVAAYRTAGVPVVTELELDREENVQRVQADVPAAPEVGRHTQEVITPLRRRRSA